MKGSLRRAGVDIWIRLVRSGRVFFVGWVVRGGGMVASLYSSVISPSCGISNRATFSTSSLPAGEALWVLIISF